jgi:DNA invertase Pin-like site-specific DNA recombinase
MLIGYARTSTVEQAAGFDAQLRDLEAVGCERIFREQVSSVAQREQLEAMLNWARRGDTVVVTKLDRLARSVRDLLSIVDRLNANGVALRVLTAPIDTASATGKLVLSLLGSIAEFERSLMLERQREGIVRAKAAGKYTGRQPTAQRRASEILELRANGAKPADIVRATGLSRTSVWRILSVSRETSIAPPPAA